MIKTADVPELAAGIWGRLGGNPRLCYRRFVEWMAPDTQAALTLLGQCKPFLVSSTGRSGTMWLAGLLNEIQWAYVVHEPIPEESFYHAEAFKSPQEALPYLRDFRLREMAFRVECRSPDVYGEVNGLLRRHAVALRELVPQIRIVHLVRDGRNFVTSVMHRKTYTTQDKIYGSFQPPADAIAPAEWRSMDRFARICWVWAHENAHIRKNADHRAKFEEITTRYDLFRAQILDPLELDLSEAIWGRRTNRPLNSTQVKSHPEYEHWSDEQKDTFWRLCEAEMAVYGYFR